ncbi:MAG: hypothetical protein AAFN10_07815 [Bacteroidota bacterium]
MKTQHIILSVFISLIATQAFAGGGWPQKKGEGFLKIGQWWVIADKHYTDQGQIDPNLTQAIFNTSFYGEYGLTDRLTAVAYVPFFSRAYSNNLVSGTTGEVLIPGEAINGFGDTDIGLQYGLFSKGSVSVSARLILGLPLGNASGGTAGNLQTGDGEFNQLLQVDAGAGFNLGGHNAYANAYVGFNNRTQGFSDEIRYGIEGGVSFLDNDRLLLILRVYGIESLQNGTLSGESNSTSIFANNSEHLTISPEIAYQWNDKWGVSASYAQAVRGSVIFANPAYSVGVFFKLK